MATKKMNNDVIVRCREAGVWFGTLKSQKGDVVELSNARRLWRWWGYFTLSELALHGPHPEHIAENRYAETMPAVTLRGWCELLPCTSKAVKGLRGIRNANR